MKQFLVPQFIDAEDKIIGPVTIRQFIMLVVGGLVVFLMYRLLTFTTFLILGIPFFGLLVSVAFVPVNGRPMHFFLLSLTEFFRRPTLRVWNNILTTGDVRSELQKKDEVVKTDEVVLKSPLQQSKLAELSLKVDTGGVYREIAEEEQDVNLSPTTKK